MADQKPPDPRQPAGLTYRDSGVDIEKADQAKSRIRELARSTFDKHVASDIGAFAGVYRPDFTRFQQPVLVSSADGVGTKLKIAFLTGIHTTVGVDLVSHCTNDIMVQGALPLFFLDYIACGQLEPGVVEQIVQGLVEGCRASQCALLGGETAEMPDFYQPGEYDLAGFIVGIADEATLFGPASIKQGDVLIGLPSSGLHTNGFSLVRRLFLEQEGLKVDSQLDELEKTLGEELLIPHRNYFELLKGMLFSDDLHAMAHITGGGIPANLKRILPDNLDAIVEKRSWDVLPVFRSIQTRGSIQEAEMFQTFNMGIGMILIIPQIRLPRVEAYLKRHNEAYRIIGEVVSGKGEVRLR